MEDETGDSGQADRSGAVVEIQRRLEEHLRHWLGTWPPREPITLATSAARSQPGWDGRIRDVAGVATPEGAVVSVPQPMLEQARALTGQGGIEALRHGLGPLLGRPGAALRDAVFRWSDHPVELPDAGVWLPWDDRRVPQWLRPFGGDVLVALERGRYVAGVGIKRHDQWGHELAVVTEDGHRRNGLARRLVAQAATRVIARGAVPTYLHDRQNVASAHVADAAGFPDRGWLVLVLWDA